MKIVLAFDDSVVSHMVHSGSIMNDGESLAQELSRSRDIHRIAAWFEIVFQYIGIEPCPWVVVL